MNCISCARDLDSAASMALEFMEERGQKAAALIEVRV